MASNKAATVTVTLPNGVTYTATMSEMTLTPYRRLRTLPPRPGSNAVRHAYRGPKRLRLVGVVTDDVWTEQVGA